MGTLAPGLMKCILYASDLGGDSDAGLQFAVRLTHGLDVYLTVAHVWIALQST
jgi:hypothetical protein